MLYLLAEVGEVNKLTSKKSRSVKLDSKKAYVSLLIGVVLVAVAYLLFYSFSMKNREPSFSCKDTIDSFSELNTKQRNNINALKAQYNKVKEESLVTNCDTSQPSEQVVDLLVLNHKMAIYAYRFGEYKESKVYADKALKFNKQVSDKSRRDLIGDKESVIQEMEAIKNENF